MVSFTQLVAVAIATASPIIAAATPVTKVKADLQFISAGYYGNGLVTAEGAYVQSGATGTFTVERDPSMISLICPVLDDR
jgi:hypothetical protein